MKGCFSDLERGNKSQTKQLIQIIKCQVIQSFQSWIQKLDMSRFSFFSKDMSALLCL